MLPRVGEQLNTFAGYSFTKGGKGRAKAGAVTDAADLKTTLNRFQRCVVMHKCVFDFPLILFKKYRLLRNHLLGLQKGVLISCPKWHALVAPPTLFCVARCVWEGSTWSVHHQPNQTTLNSRATGAFPMWIDGAQTWPIRDFINPRV